MISTVLVVAAGLAVVAAVYSLWQSLRAAFGAVDSHAFSAVAGSVERQSLEDRKASLLRGLKDLKFEYQIGKLSDDDYRILDGELRALARKVMRLLDEDIKGYHDDAKKDVEEYLREHVSGDPYRAAPVKVEGQSEVLPCASCGTENDLDAETCGNCGSHLKELVCASCETVNDGDAAFCKKCAEPLGLVAETESEAESGAEMEAEAEAEAEADADADADAETETETETDADAASDADAESGDEREDS